MKSKPSRPRTSSLRWSRHGGGQPHGPLTANQLAVLRAWAAARGLEVTAEFVTEDSASGVAGKGVDFAARLPSERDLHGSPPGSASSGASGPRPGGTSRWMPSGRPPPTGSGRAGSPPTPHGCSSGASRGQTAPGRYSGPTSSSCSPARAWGCENAPCGGCSTRPPHARLRCSRSTSRTWTSPTAALRSAVRAVRLTSSSGRPEPPGSCHACSRAASPGRYSSPSGKPACSCPRPILTRQAGPASATSRRRPCSPRPPAVRRCTSSGTRRSLMTPRTGLGRPC